MAFPLASPLEDCPAPTQREDLERYARATWRSFEKLVVPTTGLPADFIDGALDPGTRARFTSPTNIAMYVWATLAARDLAIISEASAQERFRRVLDALAKLERHEPSGQFYNWYDPRSLAKLTSWPESPGGVVYPFVSSVDNGWLASALLMLASAVPALHDEAWQLATSMSFACYYDALAKEAAGGGPGLLRGGFWREGEAPPGSDHLPRGDYSDMGEAVVYTDHHYATFNSEPRIASYIGIALGQLPREHYFAAWRTYPDTGEFAWQRTKPVGAWRSYLGVAVFEGAYAYRGRRLLPTWGGSMFEALMPALVVPEKRWGAKSWAITHPLYVESQIEFGLDEAGYGYWGFSPASDPAGGYREYGVDAIGIGGEGYTSDVERLTHIDSGWDSAGRSRPVQPIEDYGQGVVTPHAAFLALDYAPDEALANLAALQRDFPALYGAGGFKDAVNVGTGQVGDRYLALDQGLVMAAIANALNGGRLQEYLAPILQPAIEPLMAMEEFAAGR
jgi:Putative glucoamylase/Protein of unknown function (DUF3131)